MYHSSDPRASLATARPGATATAFAAADILRFHETAPQEDGPNGKTWIGRGQNFVVGHSDALPGASFERRSQVDEYVVLLPDTGSSAQITWQGRVETVPGHSIAFVPSGDSVVVLPNGGRLIRMFTSRSDDMAKSAANAASYDALHPNIPPFQPWPAPKDGWRVRSYSLEVPPAPGRFGRIWRCSTLMVNVLPVDQGPRDITRLSPHHHDDFEQGSLALEGSYTHHIRWPWTPDLNAWRADEHALCGAPSLTIIPPPAIHTSRSMEPGVNQLVDIFSPPRMDFSLKPGWVLNADDYPMPEGTA